MRFQGKVVTRIRGGLGNQLFCFAAARRLAAVNDAELVIDDVSGFLRDRQYRRRYLLDGFEIPARKATPAERLVPFERGRRLWRKLRARRQPFAERAYVEHEGFDFDPRLLFLKVTGVTYLDGLWLSDLYFRDHADLIRRELRIIPPEDATNQRMAEMIRSSDGVALHVRWFDAPGAGDSRGLNITADYYHEAMAVVESRVREPHYFLFSDNPGAASTMLDRPGRRMTVVSHNAGDRGACADLWLMTQCRHFITANSTFSWWGAWLANVDPSRVIAPDLARRMTDVPDSRELVPREWLKV